MSETTKPRKRRYALEPQLQELFGACSLGAAALGDPFAAEVIAKKTEELAHAWAKLADKSPAVKRVLIALTSGSSYGEAAMVTLGVALPILWHRGIVPDELGVPFARTVMPESEEVKAAAARTPTGGMAAAAARASAPSGPPPKPPKSDWHPMGAAEPDENGDGPHP